MPSIEVWACRSCGEFDRIYFPRWVYASSDNLRDAIQYRDPNWNPWDETYRNTAWCYCDADSCKRVRATTRATTIVP